MKLKKTLAFPSWLQPYWSELITALLVLSFFLLSVDLYQYLTTEVWWLWDETSWKQNTFYLLGLIVLSAFLPMKSWLTKWPKLGLMIMLLFIVTLYGHRQYERFYAKLQETPRIRSLSKEWGVPWSYVKLTGKNFGSEWEPGQVRIGETEMIIRKWTPKEIIFEIDAIAAIGQQELVVTNSVGQRQKETISFEVREHVN